MADQIGFYGNLPQPKSSEADRKERREWEERKDSEARERAIQAAVDAVGLCLRDDRDEDIVRAAAEAAIESILESLGDYSW